MISLNSSSISLESEVLLDGFLAASDLGGFFRFSISIDRDFSNPAKSFSLTPEISGALAFGIAGLVARVAALLAREAADSKGFFNGIAGLGDSLGLIVGPAIVVSRTSGVGFGGVASGAKGLGLEAGVDAGMAAAVAWVFGFAGVGFGGAVFATDWRETAGCEAAGLAISPNNVERWAAATGLPISDSITMSLGPPIMIKCSTSSRRTNTNRRLGSIAAASITANRAWRFRLLLVFLGPVSNR